MPDKLEHWPLDRLVPYDRNARTHSAEQVAQIAASIQEFGFTNPILVASDDGILAGHGRLAAAKDLGLREVPVVVLDHLTPTQRRAYVLADNKLALNAGWDVDMLAGELQALQTEDFDLSLLGWSDDELAELMLEAEELPPEDADADAVPEPPAEPVTKPGDVWLMGKHRVMCGDSTAITDVERLMDGGKADLVFTDPPYNIASENKGVAANVSQAHEKLMASEWDMDFCFEDVQACLLASIAPSATVYVCTSHHLAASIWTWMKTWSDHNNWCTWSKPNPMPSLMKRHWTWNAELICYATRGKHVFNFPDEGHALSTWTIAKVNGQSGHPTEKPVAVPEHAITHSSKKGQMVLDLFGGSGSTLIACEKTGRQSRLMELDPRYCDVIINRWQQFTGKTATLESTGEPFPVAE
jgi:DNA modification methylase